MLTPLTAGTITGRLDEDVTSKVRRFAWVRRQSYMNLMLLSNAL
jgi:hypothetical protein